MMARLVKRSDVDEDALLIGSLWVLWNIDFFPTIFFIPTYYIQCKFSWFRPVFGCFFLRAFDGNMIYGHVMPFQRF